MAEIKSTLDLVLEKTKNLNISDEERKTLKKKEAAGKIKGLVQKYLDGVLGIPELLQEIEEAGSAVESPRQLLSAETAARLDPLGDNDRLLQLIDAIFSGGTEKLRAAAAKWKLALLKERRAYAAAALKGWNEKKISGTALIPNMDKDPAWKSCYGKHLAAFRGEASSLLAASAHSDK